ncbi:hypothetical protein [Dyadobacter sediminis]|nr:hypothetical protein [Dyadobacter sediminis]
MLTLAAVFTACDKDQNEPAPQPETTKEFKYVRLLVSDEVSNQISFIDPFTSKVSTFDGKFPLANLYATASGRYAAVLYQNQNLVEVFDSGLQSHTDHIDEMNAPKWATITADGLKPTHFKSKGAESLIFNDNDGTLSAGNEAEFNKAGAKFRMIKAGLLPHHGAMAQFDNGNYAVTTAPAAGASPNRVQIIDKNGNLVHASTLEIGNIHGNATDGNVAVFGGFTNSAATAGGVLVVSASGEQRLIPNPEGFGAFRLANVYYASSAQKFIGFVATKGAYLIDIKTDKITSIYAGSDAFQCKVDYAGKNLLVLTLDGKLRIYDLSTGALKKEGSIISPVGSTDTYKPVLEATAKFAYIALPSSGEVYQIDLENLSSVIKHKVSSRPVRLTLFGFENNAAHGE